MLYPGVHAIMVKLTKQRFFRNYFQLYKRGFYLLLLNHIPADKAQSLKMIRTITGDTGLSAVYIV